MRTADRLGIALASSVVLVDQGTKWLVDQGMELHTSIQIIPGLLNLTYVRNTGAAFGILAAPSAGIHTVALAAFSIVAVGVIIWVWSRNQRSSGLFVCSLALILGGAVGNLIDRVRLGEVIDFIDLYWRTYHWPAFNLADSAITVGAVLLVSHLFLTRPS